MILYILGSYRVKAVGRSWGCSLVSRMKLWCHWEHKVTMILSLKHKKKNSQIMFLATRAPSSIFIYFVLKKGTLGGDCYTSTGDTYTSIHMWRLGLTRFVPLAVSIDMMQLNFGCCGNTTKFDWLNSSFVTYWSATKNVSICPESWGNSSISLWCDLHPFPPISLYTTTRLHLQKLSNFPDSCCNGTTLGVDEKIGFRWDISSWTHVF